MIRPSPETLAAFVDGELDERTAQSVTAWLADHPHEQYRMAAITNIGSLLRDVAHERGKNALGVERIVSYISVTSGTQNVDKNLSTFNSQRQRARSMFLITITLGLIVILILSLQFTPKLRGAFWPTPFSITKEKTPVLAP